MKLDIEDYKTYRRVVDKFGADFLNQYPNCSDYCNAQIKELEAANEDERVDRWKPEPEGIYWMVGHLGDVLEARNKNYEQTYKSYIIGNVYKTEALATHARDKQLLLVELQDFADQSNDGKDRPELLGQICSDGSAIRPAWAKFYSPGIALFYSVQGITAAIKHFGDRLNILIN